VVVKKLSAHKRIMRLAPYLNLYKQNPPS